MKNLLKMTVVAALVSASAGCMWSRMRMNDPEIANRARAITPGRTQVADLPRILGAQPTRKRTVGDAITYEYSYSDAKTKSFSLILVSWSRTENVTETLYVEADARTGLVTAVPRLVHHEPEWRFWPFDDEDERPAKGN